MGLRDFLVLLFILNMATYAVALEALIVKPVSTEKLWSFSATAALSETPVDVSSADHVRSYSVAVTGGLKLPLAESWLNDPSLTLSLGYEDEIGYEDNVSNITNTTLSFTGLSYEINDQLELIGGVDAVFATNSDARVYHGFIGAGVLKSGLLWTKLVPGLVLSSNLQYAYSYYEYATNKGGFYNPESALSLTFSARYAIKKVSFATSFANATLYLADGSKTDDKYSGSVSVSYNQNEQLSYSLAVSKRDRTYGYDGISPNINFIYADQSVVTTSVRYTL